MNSFASVFLLTLLFIQLESKQETAIPDCPIRMAKENERYLLLNDFSRFDQLNFTGCKRFLFLVQLLEISPQQNLILDNSLNVTGLHLASFDSNALKDTFSVQFFSLKGIDIKAKPLYSMNLYNTMVYMHIFWLIDSSDFNFYMNSTHLIDKDMCRLEYFSTLGQETFMTQVYNLFLRDSIRFPTRVCPLVFRNANLKVFDIGRLSSSSLNKKVLNFLQPLGNNITLTVDDINSNIFQLIVKVYHMDLDTELLNIGFRPTNRTRHKRPDKLNSD